MPWQATSETFVERTELPEPNYLDWIRGTYTATIPISDRPPDQQSDQESEVLVPLTVHLDFTTANDNNIRWSPSISGPAQSTGVKGLSPIPEFIPDTSESGTYGLTILPAQSPGIRPSFRRMVASRLHLAGKTKTTCGPSQ